jgi:hypothetical protein
MDRALELECQRSPSWTLSERVAVISLIGFVDLAKDASHALQAAELTARGHVMQRLFHRRITEAEPPLHEVHAQHTGPCKRHVTLVTCGRERGNQRLPFSRTA